MAIRLGAGLRMQRWAVLGLARLAKSAKRRRGWDEAAHLRTGHAGELEAFFYLRQLGYTVVARRWRTAKLRGDVDLIAWQGGTLCFVEVKTRTRRDLVPAEFAVDHDKQTMLRRMAGAYLRHFSKEHRENVPVRFDVVSVYMQQGQPPEVEVFRDAF